MPDPRDISRVRAPHAPATTTARSRVRPISAALGLALAVTTVASLVSAPASAGATTPVERAGAGLLAIARPAKAGPHAVAPSVGQTTIGSVSAKDSAGLAASLGVRAAPGSTLVAHVSRPSMKAFSLVAVTWQHGSVSSHVYADVRTRTDGVWSKWTRLGWDEDGPASGQESTATDGTSPLWVDRATGVEVAVYSTGGRPHGVQVSTIDPGTSSYDAPAAAAESLGLAKDAADAEDGTFPGMPRVMTRDEWGADPKLGDACWDPKYGTTFKTVVVHHTAGSNDYTADEGPALVRGIYAYHTVSRHWCDIGYNFLVDRYGAIYEGRRGGMRLPVRGAHAGDYNVDTTGISLMGNFDIAKPTLAMKRSLISLIAWRMGTAYHGAYGKGFIYDRKINRITGHRDVMETACPGRYVYAWLPRLREKVSERLGDYESVIEKKWRALGGKKSDLGKVAVGERGEYGGHHTTFAHGRIYYSSAGVFTLYDGAILKKYIAQGGVAGELNYPTTGVWTVPGNLGYAAEFKGGRIYWSKDTRAKMLTRGAILKHYIDDGAAHGELGFPTRQIYTIDGGTQANFQNGTVTYIAATGETTITLGGSR